jgi:penicillin-binding protein 1C
MCEAGMISEGERADAAAEPLQVRGWRAEATARHASWLALARCPGGGQTTIDIDVQRDVERLSHQHARTLPDEAQLAVVVIDIERAEIVALIGSRDPRASIDGQVNGAVARRSPGSALKPFVYAAAFQAGRLSPESILYDVPIERAGWAPSNFDRTFRGEVSAAEALRGSLNIPAILVAEGVGLSRCIGTMRAAGLRIADDVETRAGLGVVVGTIEVTLLDLTDAYATLGREGRQMRAVLVRTAGPRDGPIQSLDGDACRAVNDVLSTRRQRPEGLQDASDRDVPWFMWKTGTSSGRRDALAVGHNGRFAIGVWVGCFSGEGRVEFVGRDAAEPLLARLFCLGSLRSGGPDPEPPKRIYVRRPLPQPCAVRAELRILSPANGSVFAGPRGLVPIRVEANRAEDLVWFMDGELVSCSGARVPVRPGGHVLRCVSDSGEADAVRFTVR